MYWAGIEDTDLQQFVKMLKQLILGKFLHFLVDALQVGT